VSQPRSWIWPSEASQSMQSHSGLSGLNGTRSKTLPLSLILGALGYCSSARMSPVAAEPAFAVAPPLGLGRLAGVTLRFALLARPELRFFMAHSFCAFLVWNSSVNEV